MTEPAGFTLGRRHPPWGRRPSPMAEFVSSWLTPAVVVVGSHGDIDETNSATMTDYALAVSIGGRGLVLDLTGVTFIGTGGFSALHRVAVGCAHANRAWSLVPGAAVSRLLRVCDPEGKLLTAESVEVALATVRECRRVR